MSRRIIAGITLASFLSMPVSALSGDNEASLLAARGQVLTQDAAGAWQDSADDSIQVGDLVRTGPDGEAVLNLPNQSKLRIAPNSQIKLTKLGPDQTVIGLERGRILGSVNSGIKITTAKTVTSASNGSFVVATSATGTGLDVLSGNANLRALDGETVQYGAVAHASDVDVKELAGIEGLRAQQYHGDVALLQGKWKGKGSGERSADDDEAAGGEQRTLPDTDVTQPVQPPVEQPPVTTAPPTTPPATTPPATTPPVTPAATVAGTGFPVWAAALIGAGLITGVVLVATNNDSDDEDIFVPVPSPSLP